MSRVKTEQKIVNEGRTGRIIARRALRHGLGNPKKRAQDQAELLQEMFFKGVKNGKTLENLRIRYATAGMEYGAEYPVENGLDAGVWVGADVHGNPDNGGVPESDSVGEATRRTSGERNIGNPVPAYVPQ